MAKKNVYFTVDPGETEGRWIAVDDQDVLLVNDKGSTQVDDERLKHALTGGSSATRKRRSQSRAAWTKMAIKS